MAQSSRPTPTPPEAVPSWLESLIVGAVALSALSTALAVSLAGVPG